MLLQQFADFLSLITIGMCFILKIPQILNLLTAKSANQISVVGLLLELTSISILFAMQLIPKVVLTILAPLCTPISVSSKVVQLMAIYQAKNADTISPITWFISAFTNLTRVFTIWMDSADILLLANFIISVILSSSIMFSAIYYRWNRVKQD
ncbi:PQ-loop repeat-containing protein 3 [Melipona quadrifasciata]|uniref:PQ-loop repeat-containing protein 3 n=1 Tax=Melipona quadrifasciata TaxID=166423 RepID=A0A0M9A8U1_9HYME|nr:PQ-loop repeat-containing protein 3 [Melipona quadrifasciata]